MSFIKYLVEALGAIIRKNHMNPAVAVGARICDLYLSYYWNQRYWNMNENGELLLLRTLAAHNRTSHHRLITVFDIGANTGAYTRIVRSTIPDSVIHCFEIVPRTREALITNLSDMKDIVVSDCGLSNAERYLEIGYNSENDPQAREISSLTEANEVIACKVQTGDMYVAQHHIETIDLIKIDTEGHEIAVLKGFEHTLHHARIRMVQFEYGTTWIAPCHFMHEAYAILEPAGFLIGRLYPDGVFFKPYNRLEDDHFRMGNYVAVHERSMSLINELNLNSTGRRTKLKSKS